jgi:hypothetical protein
MSLNSLNFPPTSPALSVNGQASPLAQNSTAGQSNFFGTANIYGMPDAATGVQSNTTFASWAALLAEMMDMTAMGSSSPMSPMSMSSAGTTAGTSTPTNVADFWLQQLLGELGGVSQPLLGQTTAALGGDNSANGAASSSVGPMSSSVLSSLSGANDLFPGSSPANGSSTNVPSQSVTDAVNQASAAFGLPVQLINSVIQTESGYQPNAVSSAGAIGLMQLMPATAQEMGVQNPYDPVQNIWGGTRYLSSLVNQFHGDMKLAVAAYNAGPGAVLTHGGVPPYPETQHYVQKVLQGAGMNV